MTAPEGVALVVVSTNEGRLLPELLAGLPAACEGIRSYELIVVDNKCSDGTPEIVAASAPDATIIRLERRVGYATALNAGFAAATSHSAVFALNPDIRFLPRSIACLVEALADPAIGIAVPRLVDEQGGLYRSLRREPTVLRAFGEALLGGRRAGRHELLGEVIHDLARYEAPGSADWASGCAMLISRACLDAIGPWDESFFLYSEETEFALRARDHGFGLRYVPDAIVVHLGGDPHSSPRWWTILTVNRLRLFRRRHGRLRTVGFWVALTLNEGSRALAGRSRAVHSASFWALLRPSRRPPEVAG